MNFTDVDDRIIANAAAAGVGIREYTDKYIEAFLADRRALGLEDAGQDGARHRSH